MTQNSLSYFRANAGGFNDFSPVHSGSEAVTATLQNNVIKVEITNLGSSETVTLDTPFDFEIVDVYMRVTNGGNVNPKTVVVKNNATAVSVL